MLDHISYSVNNFEKSAAFYDATLSLLGYERLYSSTGGQDKSAGYGKEGKPAFWIGTDHDASNKEHVGAARGVHIAFQAQSPEDINRWHAKCLELGGKDNGAPGPRPEYHPSYYGGFVIDPNGWRIEAVLHNYGSKR